MNEILLVILVLIALVGTHFLVRKLSQKSRFYLKLASAVLLLLLIWLTYNNEHLPFRILLSVLALSSLYKELLSLGKADVEKS